MIEQSGSVKRLAVAKCIDSRWLSPITSSPPDHFTYLSQRPNAIAYNADLSMLIIVLEHPDEVGAVFIEHAQVRRSGSDC